MAVTNVRGRQLKDDDVLRQDLNVTTSGSAVIRKVIAGTNISISSTGVDAGTGDVTISTTGLQTALNGTGYVYMTGTTVGYVTGTASQFLKADGTLDNNTYLTTAVAAATYLPLAGGTISGNLGIGVSASYKLDVSGTGHFVNTINSTNGGSLFTGTIPTNWLYSLEVTAASRYAIVGQGNSNAATFPTINSYGSVGVVGVTAGSTGGRANIGVFGYTYFTQNMSTNSGNTGYGGYFLAEGRGSVTDFIGNYTGIYAKAAMGSDTGTGGSLISANLVAIGNAQQTTYGALISATGGGANYGVHVTGALNYFSGNVGIGVSGPIARLQLGSSWAANPGGGNQVYLSSTGFVNSAIIPELLVTSDIGSTTPGGSIGLALHNTNTTAGAFAPLIVFSKREIGASNYNASIAAIGARTVTGTGASDSWIDGELIFYTAPTAGSGLVERVRIDQAGSLGVGTSTPLARVHISQDGGAATVRLLQLDNSNVTYQQNVYLDMNISKDVLWGQGSAGGGTFWSAGTRGFGWSINGSRIVTFDQNGNVGIGTANPGVTLDVNGNARVSSVIIGTDQTYGNPYRVVAFGANQNGYNRIFAASDTTDGMFFAAATGRGFIFRPNGGTSDLVTISTAGNITATAFVKSGGTATQFLKADGSVDPTTYLTASNSLFVGTTSISLGRTSAAQSLTGITSIDGYANNIRSGIIADLNNSWLSLGTSIDNALQVFRYASTAANSPEVLDNANWVMNIYSHPSGGVASYGHQISGVDNNNIYVRYVQNGGFGPWYKIWTSGTLTNLSQLTNGPGYITGNQTITLSGAVTGSGATAITTTLANSVVGIANLSATGTASASTYLRGDNTWASIPSANSTTRYDQSFVATAGQTVITVNNALAAGYFDVYINGVKANADSYTFSGTTITFVDALLAGDIVDVINYVTVSQVGTAYGTSYSMTSGSGTGTAIFDTIDRTGAALYEVVFRGNPNEGGSGNYLDFVYGKLLIGTGYNGSAVAYFIQFIQEAPMPRSMYASGGGNLTVNAVFLSGGSEYNNLVAGSNYTVRFKVSGYNASFTGASSNIYLKQIG